MLAEAWQVGSPWEAPSLLNDALHPRGTVDGPVGSIHVCGEASLTVTSAQVSCPQPRAPTVLHPGKRPFPWSGVHGAVGFSPSRCSEQAPEPLGSETTRVFPSSREPWSQQHSPALASRAKDRTHRSINPKVQGPITCYRMTGLD